MGGPKASYGKRQGGGKMADVKPSTNRLGVNLEQPSTVGNLEHELVEREDKHEQIFSALLELGRAKNRVASLLAEIDGVDNNKELNDVAGCPPLGVLLIDAPSIIYGLSNEIDILTNEIRQRIF